MPKSSQDTIRQAVCEEPMAVIPAEFLDPERLQCIAEQAGRQLVPAWEVLVKQK